jgi:hypothetical protein
VAGVVVQATAAFGLLGSPGRALLLDDDLAESAAVQVSDLPQRARADEAPRFLEGADEAVVETNLVAPGDTTEAVIAKNGRPQLFFRASEVRDYVLDTNSTFTGLGFSDIQIDPPDSMGAVGPNHFVELLNCNTTNTAAVAVYDKSGHLVAKTNTLDFFRIGTNYPTGSVMADPASFTTTNPSVGWPVLLTAPVLAK